MGPEPWNIQTFGFDVLSNRFVCLSHVRVDLLRETILHCHFLYNNRPQTSYVGASNEAAEELLVIIVECFPQEITVFVCEDFVHSRAVFVFSSFGREA